ncbi:MAG: hypothetical protein HZA46_03995 [Planctomycetales bacterium]|nr:hypothetical protein [Planctomycetales bacterium]
MSLIENKNCRRCLSTVLGLSLIAASSLLAQDGFRARTSDYRPTTPSVPTLSEATAILEAAVRTMYKNIEPGKDTSPNELLAYADLRALRLYTGALEVSGWSFEQASTDYQDLIRRGGYRAGRGQLEPQAIALQEKFRAYRETVRTLLYRVRSTAVAVEHQVSFCDIQVIQEWQQDVLPALRDTIAATEPMLQEELAFFNDRTPGYRIPGQTTSKIVPTSGTGVPEGAVDVAKNPTFKPYAGQGRGQGRYFEIRAFGGPVRVVAVRFRSHENALGAFANTVEREVAVDDIATPGQPLYIPCNRKRMVDISDLEIDWDAQEGARRTFAIIELVESNPGDRN